ncbi:MAG TPA: hypothetical protein VM573_03085 [Actinomycetota bacterium]|nr:hypothetical protein [Actinomycetota bacterium]
MRRVAPIVLALLLAACRPERVELEYRFEEGETFAYVMTADADASWTIGGTDGSGSYRIVVGVHERVEEVTAEGALVHVAMTPLEVREEGLPSPGSSRREFVLRAGSKGEVLDVLEVGGVAADDLHPDELAFIGTYRPPLPLEPVRLRGTWESEQQVSVGRVFQDVVTVGSLEALGLERGSAAARLAYTGEGPLVWTTSLPQGEAELNGASQTRTVATVDLEEGMLRGARSTTRGNFEVRVMTSDQVEVTGTLELTLRLDLRAVDE